jgi:hypothetical protein
MVKMSAYLEKGFIFQEKYFISPCWIFLNEIIRKNASNSPNCQDHWKLSVMTGESISKAVTFHFNNFIRTFSRQKHPTQKAHHPCPRKGFRQFKRSMPQHDKRDRSLFCFIRHVWSTGWVLCPIQGKEGQQREKGTALALKLSKSFQTFCQSARIHL